MIVANEVRSAMSAWTDRLVVSAVVAIALFAAHSSLAQVPVMHAVMLVAVLASVAGAVVAGAVERRLAFHRHDGIVAADALTHSTCRYYLLGAHAIACAILIAGVMIVSLAAVAAVPIGYILGAGFAHAARRVDISGPNGWLAASRRSTTSFMRTPVAGASAAILVLLPLAFRTMEPPVTTALVAALGAGAAIALTTLDAGSVRFMTISGFPARRIIGLHARAIAVFFLLTVLPLLALSYYLIGGIVASIVTAALVLMTARVLAYRIHAKRTADMIVAIGSAVVGVAAFATPLLAPFVVIAILWHLHRRSARATWLLT